MRKPVKMISGSKSINRIIVGRRKKAGISLWIKLPRNCVMKITKPQIRSETSKKPIGKANSSTVFLTPNTHELSSAGSFVLSYKPAKNPENTKKGMNRRASNVRGIKEVRNVREVSL